MRRGMSRTGKWLTSIGIVGLTAGALAALLLWLVLTRPLAVVEAIGRFP